MDITKRLHDEIVSTVDRDILLHDAIVEIKRLRAIEAAARNLVAVKGRHHSEVAYQMWRR